MSDFLKLQQDSMETIGFWGEIYKTSLMISIENNYKIEIIREWCIDDILPYDKKFLIKWKKRYRPLTDAELNEKYGRIE